MTHSLKVFLIIGVICWQQCAMAESLDKATGKALRHLGKPAELPKNVIADDDLGTNHLPATITIQKVVPREMVDQVVDQLLKLTDLGRSQIVKGADRGIFGTPGVRYFGDLYESHVLAFIPAQGWSHYTRSLAVDDKGDATLVAPPKEILLPRALELAKAFGLSESDFARHPATGQFDATYMKIERSNVRSDTRVVQRSIFLRRSINGLPVVTGHLYGGLTLGLGLNGVIHEFALTARATKPESEIKTASLAEQITAIKKSGKVFAVRWPGEATPPEFLQNAFLKLQFVEAVYFEAAPEEAQKIIPPLLRWEGELQVGNTNHPVIFFTPVAEAKTQRK